MPNEEHVWGEPHSVLVLDSGFAVIGKLLGEDSAPEHSVWTWQRWLSADGVSWDRASIPAFDAAEERLTNWGLHRVVMWGDMFVAVATEERRDHIQFWTSADGIDWQQVPDRADFVFHRPSDGDAFGPGAIFACCGTVTDLRVEDGIIVAEGAPPCEAGGPYPPPDVCDSRPAVVRWTSDDAIHWDRTIVEATYDWTWRDTPLPTSTGFIRRWNASDGGVAGIETSTDGANWQVVWRTTGFMSALHPFSGGYLGVGHDGESYLAASSEDGVEWVQSSGWPDMHGQMDDFVESDDRIVAVGQNGTEPSDLDVNGEPILPYVWVNPPLPEAP